MLKFIAQVLVYEEGDYLEQAVTPWLKVCERISLFEGGFQTTINLGYPARSTDKTIEIGQQLAKNHSNVKFNFHSYYNEPILRNDHLFQTIRDFGRDETVLFILDGDEVYSDEDVKRCITQVTEEYNTVNTTWVSMKNYINSSSEFYHGFKVPRFFRLKGAVGFSGYNNVNFEEGIIQTDIKDVIPKHMSWTPLEKACRKMKWQHDSLGWECSFKIENNHVVLNNDYYLKNGKQKPIIYQE